MNKGGDVSGGAAPTGCYKCGRPGHWSRDCPFDPNSSDNNSNNNNPAPPLNSNYSSNSSSRPPLPIQKPKEKAQRRTTPKLTPDLLLSDAGIGYILRYFPRSFKCRGPGYEFKDLKHLLVMYAEWHSKLLPYFNFHQFIEKVEKVGSAKRVKVCLRDLQVRVENGGDPTKLYEPQAQGYPIDEQGAPGGHDIPYDLPNEDPNIFQDEIPEKATEVVHGVDVAADTCRVEEAAKQRAGNCSNLEICNQNQISEEQRARMEANRLKALERATARRKA